MKKFSKILSVALLVALVLSLGIANAFAAGTPSITVNPANGTDVTGVDIDYTWYRILEASIASDPTVGTDGTTTTSGVVSYYVTTQDRVNELTETGLFTINKVDGQDMWYVVLDDSTTSADDLVAAFSADTFDLSVFPRGTFDKTTSEAKAESGEVAPGYYYITSTLGSKIALQTLSPVTINEKNEYTTDLKTIPEVDKNSEIGQKIVYDLTVNVPVTATEQIVLTDTMSKGLTFSKIVSQKHVISDTEEEDFIGTVSDVAAADNNATKFTITYSKEQIQGLVAGKSSTQKIVVKVEVIVNEDALIDQPNPNTLDLKYGNVYEAQPITVNTQPSKFTFDKVDGSDKTKLSGAVFELRRTENGDPIPLVQETEGEVYRIATAEEIADAAAEKEGAPTIVTQMTTAGKVITVNGIDKDLTYQLVEITPPEGYNLPDDVSTEVKAGSNISADIVIEIVNNKGTTLPSTGGIGTTIFYVVGGVLVLAAIILLVTKKRMSE